MVSTEPRKADQTTCSSHPSRLWHQVDLGTAYNVNQFHVAAQLPTATTKSTDPNTKADEANVKTKWLVLNALNVAVCKHDTEGTANLCAKQDLCAKRNTLAFQALQARYGLPHTT